MGPKEANSKIEVLWGAAKYGKPVFGKTLVSFGELKEVLEAFAEDEPVEIKLKRRSEDGVKGYKEGFRAGCKWSEKGYKYPPFLDDIIGAHKECFAKAVDETMGTPPKEETAQEIKIRALEASWKHWDENYYVSLQDSTDFSISPESCACCNEYDSACILCPLGQVRCCEGRHQRVHHLKSMSLVDFPALQKACKAVRDYIRTKLTAAMTANETRGTEFGVGDIVDVHLLGEGRIMDIAGDCCAVKFDSDSSCSAMGIPLRDCKLVFPASRIPKELDGIRCEPKGDIVELQNGDYAMMLAFVRQEVIYLCWRREDDKFYLHFGGTSFSKQIIWPCKEVKG